MTDIAAMTAVCQRSDCLVYSSNWDRFPNAPAGPMYNKDGSNAELPPVARRAWRCTKCGHCWTETLYVDGVGVVTSPAPLPPGTLGLAGEAPIVSS